MKLFAYRDIFCTQMGLPLSARFNHPDQEIDKYTREVSEQHPEHSAEEARGRALARLDALKYVASKKSLLPLTKEHNWRRWAEIGAFLFVLLLASAHYVHCQSVVVKGQAKGTTAANSATVTPVDANHNAIDVNIAGGGGSGGTASTFGATFPSTGTAIGASDGTNMQNLVVDASKFLKVNCAVGCSGSSFADNSAFTFGTTAISLMGGVLDDVAPNAATENSAALARITAARAFHINLRNNAGTEMGTSSNPLQVTGANGTFPVTGTFWQATQPVSGTFWQATQPVSGTFWQATQPISAASLPLPTGAAQDSSLTTLDTDVKSNVTLHAGSNIVGKVTTDQTTHGTTDLVAADITKVGGAAVALGQTTAAASIPVVIASDQSPLAVFARTMPLLNYSSFTLQDANTVLWVTTMSDTGALNTVTTTSGTVLPLYFNDIATRSTYQIGVTTAGVLTETLVTFNPQYPAAIGFVTSGGKKSALLMNSVTFYALQPTSVADWNVAVADGGDLTQGATTDTRVAGDAPGSLSAKLRAISYAVDQIVRQKSVNARVTGSFNRPVSSTGDALDVNVKYPPASADPCSGRKRSVAISQTGNAQLVGAGPGTIWICSIFVMGADAENVSLVEGSGATCATGTAAVIGGTTAAAGPNMAANGGFAPGNGLGTIAATAIPGNSLCLFQSGSGRVAGNLTFAYAQ